MNSGQILYALALAGVFAWRGPSFAAWVLLANMVATLAACLAMDEGWLDRDGATLAMMLIDFASAAFLLTGDAVSKIIAAGYAVTVPLYSLSILFGTTESTTFAIVIGIGFAQILVAGIGGNDHGGGARNRRPDVDGPILFQGGNAEIGAVGMAARQNHLSQDGGGRG